MSLVWVEKLINNLASFAACAVTCVALNKAIDIASHLIDVIKK